MSFLLLGIYSIEVVIEIIIFYQMLPEEDKPSRHEIATDILGINLATLFLVLLFLGRAISNLNFKGDLANSFQKAMIVFPQHLIKIALFTVIIDAILIAAYYAYKKPQWDIMDTFLKGIVMNMPALIFSGVVWIFVSLMQEFLQFIRAI